MAMTAKQRRQLLAAALACLLAATAGSAVGLLLKPLPRVDTDVPVETDDLSRGGVPGESVGPLDRYAVIYRRELRKDLFPGQVVQKDLPKLPLELVSTSTEDPANAYAMVRLAGGELRLVRVGDEAAGAVVKQIRPQRVMVTFRGADRILDRQGGSP
jgi:hypothetical protein